jgi:hypothetical protein
MLKDHAEHLFWQTRGSRLSTPDSRRTRKCFITRIRRSVFQMIKMWEQFAALPPCAGLFQGTNPQSSATTSNQVKINFIHPPALRKEPGATNKSVL